MNCNLQIRKILPILKAAGVSVSQPEMIQNILYGDVHKDPELMKTLVQGLRKEIFTNPKLKEQERGMIIQSLGVIQDESAAKVLSEVALMSQNPLVAANCISNLISLGKYGLDELDMLYEKSTGGAFLVVNQIAEWVDVTKQIHPAHLDFMEYAVSDSKNSEAQNRAIRFYVNMDEPPLDMFVKLARKETDNALDRIRNNNLRTKMIKAIKQVYLKELEIFNTKNYVNQADKEMNLIMLNSARNKLKTLASLPDNNAEQMNEFKNIPATPVLA